MNTLRRRCPVCWRRVRPTARRTIEGHWDSVGHAVCPGTGEPYRITLPGRPVSQAVAA